MRIHICRYLQANGYFSRYLTGELIDAEIRILADHTDVCSTCFDRLMSLARPPAPASLPPLRLSTVRQGDQQWQRVEEALPGRQHRRSGRHLSISLVVLLVLSGGLYRLFSRPADPIKLRAAADLSTREGHYQTAIEQYQRLLANALTVSDNDTARHASLRLTHLYHLTNDNQRTVEQAKRTIQLAIVTKNKRAEIDSKQHLALSEFFLNRSSLAEYLIIESIEMGQQSQDWDYVSQGNNFLGIVATETGDYGRALECFTAGRDAASKIGDKTQRNYMTVINLGYTARTKALAGYYADAAANYQNAIDHLDDEKISHPLFISQLNAGLGDCLIALDRKPEAQRALATAKLFEAQAIEHCETGNMFLSFAVSRITLHSACD